MAKKKKDDSIRILQAFAICTHGNVLDRNLNDIRNPIYVTLSKKLKMKKRKILEVILANQPSLVLQQYRHENELPNSNEQKASNEKIGDRSETKR